MLIGSIRPKFREATKGMTHFCLMIYGVSVGCDSTARSWNHSEKSPFTCLAIISGCGFKQLRLLTQTPTHGLSCGPDFLTVGRLKELDFLHGNLELQKQVSRRTVVASYVDFHDLASVTFAVLNWYKKPQAHLNSSRRNVNPLLNGGVQRSHYRGT